jgi:hypothetical protein
MLRRVFGVVVWTTQSRKKEYLMSDRNPAPSCLFLFAGLLLVACLLGSGCIKQKIIVKVAPDGSGQIMHSMIYTKEIVAMMEEQLKQTRQMMAQHGGGGSMTNNPYYNPRMLKFLARKFGPGVSLSKSREYDKEGARGFLALYEFKDINDVQISSQVSMASMSMGQMSMSGSDMDEEAFEEQMDAMMDSMGETADPVEFKLTQGEQNQLKVMLPKMEDPLDISEDDLEEEDTESAAGASMAATQMMAGGNPFGFTGQETETQMMQKMLGGMGFSFDVGVLGKSATAEGAIPRTGKTNRWIVYDVDFGKLVSSRIGAHAMKTSQETMFSNGMDVAAFGAFSKLSGAKVQTNSFTITFK